MNLSAGSHFVNVKNGFTNCIAKLNFTIIEPPSNILGVTTSNASCSDANDGKAEVLVNGNINNFTFQWKNLTKSIILSESTSKLTRISKGNYSVVVKEKAGFQCEETKLFSIDGSSLANGEKKIYPNPTTGLVKLELCDLNANKVTIFVTNALLQSLEEKEVAVVAGTNIISVDLKNYPKGIYFIKVAVFDHDEIFRIIKQ